jgi:hypothetical protein
MNEIITIYSVRAIRNGDIRYGETYGHYISAELAQVAANHMNHKVRSAPVGVLPELAIRINDKEAYLLHEDKIHISYRNAKEDIIFDTLQKVRCNLRQEIIQQLNADEKEVLGLV